MTYGGSTYAGASYGSTSATDTGATATASATTTSTTTATGSGAATTVASATTTATSPATGTGTTVALADAQTTAATTTSSAGATVGTASAQTTAAAVASDATLNEPFVEWRVTRDQTTVEDSVFDVSPVVDTANPFGDYAVIKMDDRGGNLFDEYERGTRVDVAVSENFGITFTTRFTGYVVERRETEQSGADVLEVEAYSFDQFLRRNTVSNDQTGNTISEAFQDIIETDTPVNYNAAKVTVGDDQTLTRSYRGDPVEEVLRDLAFKSVNEEFGVDDTLDAFFRPREVTNISRGIDNTQWFHYDIPELGKEAVNEVEVWFDNGNESVIVDDSTDKLDLQDSLNLPSPGTQRKELNRPLITDIEDAEDIGRKYLTFRNATLSGTVTTFGLFDAEPGDTIDVTIDPRGIDEEFVIAATEYRWGVDETRLTIVENRGDVDDILTEISDSVQRQEMQDADRDAPKNRITTTNARALITPTWTIDGTPADNFRLVNDGRNAIRDGWRGDSNPDVATIRVGDSNAGLSRSNTDLQNQTNSASVSESFPDSTTVQYDASITQTGVAEVGLFESDGTLITRATLDTPTDINGTVSVQLAVSNDDTVSRGVLTTDGQTAVRDVIADNSPTLPTDYGYGSDGTAVTESDTALGNELVSVSLDEITIQDADSQTSWNNILSSISDTDPVVVDTTGPKISQTCFTVEGEDWDSGSDSGAGGLDGDYSGGVAATFQGLNGDVSYNFTVEKTIPESEFALYIRHITEVTGDEPEITFELDGETIATLQEGATFGTIRWSEVDESTGGFNGTWTGGDIEPGSHTLRIYSSTAGDGSAIQAIDVVAPLDALTRVTGGGDATSAYTFDNTNDGSDGFLDGPEFGLTAYDFALDTATTRRNVTEAAFSLTANDVSSNFYVELANDGSTFTRFNNSTGDSVTFASPNQDVDTNIQFGWFGSRSSATPQTGFNFQQIDTWSLTANPDAVLADDIGATVSRAVVAPNTITGQTVREAGLQSGSTLLTHHELAEFTVLADQRLASSETTRFIGPNSRF